MTIKFSNQKDTNNKNTKYFHFVKFYGIFLPDLSSKRSNTAVAVGLTAEWKQNLFSRTKRSSEHLCSLTLSSKQSSGYSVNSI